MTYCTQHRKHCAEGETCAKCNHSKLLQKKLESFAVSGIEAEVCLDIKRRQMFGINKYGTTVAGNPLELRQWLQHAFEEALDQAIYLKRAIDQIDRTQDDFK